MLAVFVSKKKRHAHKYRLGLGTFFFVCYFVWAGAGVLVSDDFRLSLVSYIGKLLFFLGVYLTVISMNLDRTEIDYFLQHFVIASTLAGLIVLSEAVIGQTWYIQSLNITHVDITMNQMRYGAVRAMGPFSQSIPASMFLAAAFFLALSQFLRRKKKYLLISSLIIAAAVFETYSRGGLIAGLITFLFLIVLMWRRIGFSKFTFGLAALALALSFLFPDYPNRLYVLAVGGIDPSLISVREQGLTEAGNLAGRIDATERVLGGLSRYIAFGVGNGVTSLGDKAMQFNRSGRVAWLIDIIPVYVTIMVEDGLPGLGFFLLFLLSILVYSYHLTRSHSTDFALFGMGLFAFVLVYVLSWLSINSYPDPFVFFGICGMISEMYNRIQRGENIASAGLS